jgi:RNA polymerase sigma-70 factor (ECF subfamily)
VGERTDKELTEGALRGEEAAFVELLSRHGPSMLALIRREAPKAEDWEDILQEALLHAWRDIAQLRDHGRIRSWLLSIARNRCRDHNKSAGRREQFAAPQALERRLGRFGRMTPEPGEQTELADMVNRLPPREMKTAEMFYLNGLTIQDIARRICVPAGTVKSRLFRARRELRRLLEEE